MTAEATDALVAALEASQGLPIPTPREYAARIERQLAQRGYEVTRKDSPRGDRLPVGYPCTCAINGRCIAHPFGPPRGEREVSP